MKFREGRLAASPSDLTNFLACQHAARLDADLALGRTTPAPGRDPDADLLAELGQRHERAYLDYLRAKGFTVKEIGSGVTDPDEIAHLLRGGFDVLAQVPLQRGELHGIADVLLRVDRPSRLGDFSYEVQDTKLSRKTKGATVLQLMTYASSLQGLQGTPGEFVYAVTPGQDHEEPFRCDRLRVGDYAAVTRHGQELLSSFLEALQAGGVTTHPEPVEHCSVCRWWDACRKYWHDKDHLSRVAHLGSAHRTELERNGVSTRRELAHRHGNLGFRPEYGSRDTYLAAAHQASVQVRSDEQGKIVVEALKTPVDKGLHRLPTPSEHDIYLDLEGTPFYNHRGLEYLWGFAGPDGGITHHWATDERSEKTAFQGFVDHATAIRKQDPSAHVYHYGAYEVSALKRLMGLHATREEELDALLRAQVFVDLHAVTRQAFRIGVESYSLKDLERVHGFTREADLMTLGSYKREMEHAIILHVPQEAPEKARKEVAAYNADDVRSTHALHQWLEQQRADLGITTRPSNPDAEPSPNLAEMRTAATNAIERLTATLPDDASAWNKVHDATALLANMIDFERRESKLNFWEKYSLQDATDEELEESPKGLVGLTHIEQVASSKTGIPTHRYRYPRQDLDLRSRDKFYLSTGEVYTSAEIVAHDPANHTIDLKQGKATGNLRPTRGFLWNHVDANMIADARLDLAHDILERGPNAEAPYRAARDLLLRLAGRTNLATPVLPIPDNEDLVSAATRIATMLDGGVLPVQGPPGSGKTFTAARVILGLVRSGRTVGVTAVSNKATANLLEEVARAAASTEQTVRIAQKPGSAPDDIPGVEFITKYAQVRQRLSDHSVDVIGGTAWLWSRPEFRQSIDTLVIDEAAQFSLATALSVATCARNLLLFGDPQQLAQPIQGAHPDGADISCLGHFLSGRLTLPPECGLFIEQTRRMSPALTGVISELFYEGRLHAASENQHIELTGTDGYDGTGYGYLGVEHEGRDGLAPEEVAAVGDLVTKLLTNTAVVHDKDQTTRQLEPKDVMVVAPFNRHVDALREALPHSINVGTVDRFQGQEAVLVIYTLGVSTQGLAPRGLRFLFDPHRLNVALSRAKAKSILVSSPQLFGELPATPEGLKLLNAHIRVVQEARSAANNP